MYLIQVLLPLYDNHGAPLPRQLFQAVRDELTDRFGGLTAHTRAPAEGLWVSGADGLTRDEIVMYEVMIRHLDTAWWREYREGLEARFQQQAVVVRAQRIQLL